MTFRESEINFVADLVSASGVLCPPPRQWFRLDIEGTTVIDGHTHRLVQSKAGGVGTWEHRNEWCPKCQPDPED